MRPYDHRPAYFYLGKLPIAVTEIIIIIQIVGMLCVVFSPESALHHSGFSATAILSGELWRVITYSLVSPPSLFWALGLFFFFSFGRQVEAALGQKGYIKLVLSCILLPAIFALCLAQLPLSLFQISSGFLGNQVLSLSVFCAAVAMMPNQSTALLSIPLKWLALAFLCISTLQLITASFWLGAIMVLTGVGTALYYMVQQGLAYRHFGFSASDFQLKPTGRAKSKNYRAHPSKKRSSKKRPSSQAKIRPRSQLASHTSSELDSILDKISAHGFQSLTQAEKDKLKQASEGK